MKSSLALCLFSLLIPLNVQAADSAPPAPAPSPVPSTMPDAAGVTHLHADGKPDRDETLVDYFWRKSDEAFHEGDYERAIGLHKAIVALTPDDVESYSVAAWLMWSLGRGDDAVQWLHKGIAANPNNWEMWDAAGQNYDLQKKFTDAEDAYGHAVQLITKEDDSQMLRRRYAHAAEKAGDIAASQRTWQDLVRDFPAEVVNKNNLQRVEALAAAKG